MSIIMHMRWHEITPEQYDAVRHHVNWEGNAPAGGEFHVAFFDNQGLRVVDMWENAETFQHFVDNRLMPGIRDLGIDSQPEVEVYPAYAVYTPAFDRKPAAELA